MGRAKVAGVASNRRYVTPEGSVQNEGDIGVHCPRPYEVAYGSLTPKKTQCENLLVPVCLSSSHMAYGSIRMEPVFMERMAAAFPDRITKITNRIRDVRGGAISEGAFFERHRGAGPYWAMIEQLFEVSRRKAGLSVLRDETVPITFRRPGVEQTALF
jgi:hypothetical protein